MSEKIPYIDMEKIKQETKQELKERKKYARCITIAQAIKEGYLDNRFHNFDNRLNYKITVYPKKPVTKRTPEEEKAFQESYEKCMSSVINSWGY